MWRWFLYTGSYSQFPWAELRDQADAAVQNPGLPFRDGHAAMAFAAAGDQDGVSPRRRRLARHGQQRQRPSSRGGPAPDGRHQRPSPKATTPNRPPS